jgi:ABC-type transporter Mla MlaB component
MLNDANGAGAHHELDVSAKHGDASWTIVCEGELVSGTAPAVRRALDACVGGTTEAITLDLAGVSAVDVVGLRAAFEAADVCSERGVDLTIAMGSRAYCLYCLSHAYSAGRTTLRRRITGGSPLDSRVRVTLVDS